jgi:hypothetical protein
MNALAGPSDKFETISYEERLEYICETVKDKRSIWWAGITNEKKIVIIQLGRMLEKQRLKFTDIKSNLCSVCGKANKIGSQRTICYSCCHKLYEKKETGKSSTLSG